MNKYEEIAAWIIDGVLTTVHEQHPEIEQVEESSMIYGESYYTLKQEIAEKIKKHSKNLTYQEIEFIQSGINKIACGDEPCCLALDKYGEDDENESDYSNCTKCIILGDKLIEMRSNNDSTIKLTMWND